MAKNVRQSGTRPYARNIHSTPAQTEQNTINFNYLSTTEDTAGQLTVSETIIQQGMEPPPHTHTREDEAFYVLEGSITFYVDNQPIPASAGSFVWLPRNLQHSFVIHSQTARVLVLIMPAGLERYFTLMGQLLQQEHVQPGYLPPAAAQKWQELSQQFGITLNFAAMHEDQ
ncbi:hypothetical protein KDW_52030 [Dictyobacter vulcani]|uniref:Cupin type-2 domain-containing protein n=1 Tax=Dictyobacter vulcani TaxID=2607529 RepID=A0A5J4KX48_9CHLR|nr:cupin domain-containing protein [Dictyobacter vulcani]GER91041.1 hypothetical protein KDW_52030 [Dictyobacter vulcani]